MLQRQGSAMLIPLLMCHVSGGVLSDGEDPWPETGFSGRLLEQ